MPASYTPKTRDSEAQEHTSSQSLQTNLSAAEATVRDVLTGKGGALFSLAPDDTIAQAVAMLKDKGVGALLVRDGQGALVGILSERDIVRQMAETPGETLPRLVRDLMSAEVETSSPDETLVRVLRRMTDGRFRHMPVIEDGALIGLVSIGDVVNFRLTALEYEALQLKQLIVG
ncbi:CBS domain-containing protein [Marinibacterium sp. SX1]|uniref:CBS domain-containing protein n=1 Tax=Marinibacterium sp. SX1 TaxID=3388424 RepID=UPI003D1838A9